jgi:DNA polymerase
MPAQVLLSEYRRGDAVAVHGIFALFGASREGAGSIEPAEGGQDMPTTVDPIQQLSVIAEQIRHCTLCPLHASRTLAVPGDGRHSARIMLIGEAPGKDEDLAGRPFVGAAGAVLQRLLAGSGMQRDDLFITNIVKCRPANNRVPKKGEITTCTSHYLFQQIALIDPQLIVLLGGVAARTLLGLANVKEARGRVITQEGRKFLVSYHPAATFYREGLLEAMQADYAILAQELQKLV